MTQLTAPRAQTDIAPSGTILGIWAHSGDEALAVDPVLDAATTARKVRAPAAQRTRTATLIGAMGRDRYGRWVADEAFVERVRPTVAHDPCPSCRWDLTTARWRCPVAGSSRRAAER